MLKFDCFPVTDQLQIFRRLLTDLRTFRSKRRQKCARRTIPQQQHLQALQNTFKILINSFYGYLGFAQGNFADFDAAARVTQIGRDLLKKMIDWLTSAALRSSRSTPTEFIRPAAEDHRNRRIARRSERKNCAEGIEVEFDEQFDAMFSYKAKNYALLTRGWRVIIKGGALKSRGLEKFQRVFLEEIIKLLMEGKPEAITGFETNSRQKSETANGRSKC